jgi:flagellar biosynthesis/type III secretory pathway protein FliH
MRRLSHPADPQGPALVLLADALAAPAASAAPPPRVEAADPADQRRRELEEAFAAARREGLAKGLSEADDELANRVEAITAKLRESQRLDAQRLEARITELNTLLKSLDAAFVLRAREAQDLAVETAYAALVRVLGQKSADRQLMRELCEEALKARGIGAATLRLSPADHADVALEDTHLLVVADSSLSPGQCVLESPRGASDTGLDVRLEAIRRAFLDGLGAHGAAT